MNTTVVTWVSLFSALVVLWISSLAIKRLFAGVTHPVLPVIVLHGLTSAAPIVLDHIFGLPELAIFPRFVVAREDALTQLTYSLYVVLTTAMLWFLAGGRSWSTSPGSDPISSLVKVELSQRVRILMQLVALLGMTVPIIGLIVAPDPSRYVDYGEIALAPSLEPDIAQHHAYLALLCTLGVLSGILWILASPSIRASTFLFVFPFVITSIWIHGKRSLPALAIVAFLAVLWQKGLVKGKRAAAIAALALLAIGAFSTFYQGAVRIAAGSATVTPYDNIRIDYGRDNQTRLAIFSYLHPDEIQILEHPGQTLLYYATLPVPRSAWPDKPFTYSQYFTGALFDTDPDELQWGMTTSWLGESVSNLGLLGFALGPGLLVWICRLGARRGPVTRLITTVLACLLLMLQVIAFLPVAIIWTVIMLWGRPKIEGNATYEGRRFSARTSNRT